MAFFMIFAASVLDLEPDGLSRKIFPPTDGELPNKENPAEGGKPKNETRPVGNTGSGDEPQTKKLRTGSEDIEKEWEAVEKPSETNSAARSEISEGEKVEAVELGGSDGEEIEKPEESEGQKTADSVGGSAPKSGLLKDW